MAVKVVTRTRTRVSVEANPTKVSVVGGAQGIPGEPGPPGIGVFDENKILVQRSTGLILIRESTGTVEMQR